MTESERIDFLAGQHQALLAAVSALTRTHSNVPLAVQEIHVSLERALNSALPSRVRESYMQGIQAEKETLETMCESAMYYWKSKET